MQNKITDLVVFPKQLKDMGTYWKYLTPKFNQYLEKYLSVFEKHRQEEGVIPPSEEDWKRLPFGAFAATSSWKWRRESLAIMTNYIGESTFDCTLEIGAWNGWLTKHLAKKSNVVIGADYFVCPFDGIKNISTLSDTIVAVQCQIEDIKTNFKPQSFDLIVLNHNLSYMNNPVNFIIELVPLLKEKGKIISLGNTFYKNPEKKIRKNKIDEKYYYNKYDLELYIKPVKGYMDINDLNLLKQSHFEIKAYRSKCLQNSFSKFNPRAPFYCYITYHND